MTIGQQRPLSDAFASDEAFRGWYEATLPRVYGYLLARTGGDVATAEDLTQTTYLEAVRTWRRFAGEANSTTWLIAIARHRLIDHYRRQERSPLGRSVREIPPVEMIADDRGWASIEQRDEVSATLRRLPAAQRLALMLHYADDLPVREVARLMQRSEKAVESLLSRARDTYRQHHREMEGG